MIVLTKEERRVVRTARRNAERTAKLLRLRAELATVQMFELSNETPDHIHSARNATTVRMYEKADHCTEVVEFFTRCL